MTIDPLAHLLRRYAFAYTAAHDLAVCDELMVDGYVLRMGDAVLSGRERAYEPAVRRQYDQYPGLGFTVHDFVSNGERCALWFTEHGVARATGNRAAWSGVSLYRWDGRRLTECRVEQDYLARRRQLRTGLADPVRPPAHDPWSASPEPLDASSERVATRWLAEGGLLATPPGALDDGDVLEAPERVRLADSSTEVLDLLSAGGRIAFHVRMRGSYAGGLVEGPRHGTPVVLYAAGIASVEDGAVRSVRAVTDRLGLTRRTRAQSG